jgi:2-polyprenyl-3-methyl-5-hydroxy-6-metoxy-1,4-benzoquinol methylase
MKYGLLYTMVTRTTGLLSRTVFHFRKTEIDHMVNQLKKLKNKKILDYGCNTGYLLYKIHKKNPHNRLYGADINKHALNYARNNYSKFTFFDAKTELFNKEKFDVIIISHVLEHIKDRPKFMKDIANMLNENGKLIIAIPQERIRGDATIFQIIFNAFMLRFENPHVVNLKFKDLKKLLYTIDHQIEQKVYTNYIYPFKSNKRRLDVWSLVTTSTKLKT